VPLDEISSVCLVGRSIRKGTEFNTNVDFVKFNAAASAGRRLASEFAATAATSSGDNCLNRLFSDRRFAASSIDVLETLHGDRLNYVHQTVD
jgi:hypothetical protein